MILVTGGAGFLGSHLVQQLNQNNHHVRVLEQENADVAHVTGEGVEIVRADIRDPSAVKQAVRGCDYVYHLAADPNLWRRDRREFDAVNHQGTRNVLQAALDGGAKRILYTSTESILSSTQDTATAVENLELKESEMIGPYCLSKFRAERAAFALAEQGAPVIVVAPTLPVGPGDRRQTPPTRMAVALCRGELPAYLDCSFNLIDARDVALGMIAAMERGRPSVRYLLGGENCSLGDWLQTLAKAANRQAPRRQVPYPLALAAAWCSERWADFVSGKNPMATVTGVKLTRRNMFFDPSASLRELNIEPRSIEASAYDAVAWYREQGWLR